MAGEYHLEKKPFFMFISKLWFRQFYLRYFSSITFIPAALAVFFIVMAFFLMKLDEAGIGYLIIANIPYLATHQEDTVVSLLATLIGGMFSLMVFSFTMVMMILTTSTSNYSPRVIPGLISKKGHQLVLGLYLGTIAYLMIVLINIGKDTFKNEVPDLAVLIGIVATLGCLIAFIYFIHSISQHIQAGNIIQNLYEETSEQLQEEINGSYCAHSPATQGWQVLKSPKTGYFQGIDELIALKFTTQHNMQMVIIPEKGRFILKGKPIALLNKTLAPDAILAFQKHIDYNFEEHVSINYLFGFKHLTEVAVKALSPGINDPGTALNAIDYLTDLFCQLQQIGRYKLIKDKNGEPRLYYRQASFNKVFYYVFSSIRNYASRDVAVQAKLLYLLEVLQEHPIPAEYSDLFHKERMALLQNAKQGFENDRDLEILKESFD